MRTALGMVVGLVVVVLVVLGPNLLWLTRSTAHIANDSGFELRDLRVVVADDDILVGVAGSGQSRFVYLPVAGESTLRVSYVVDGRPYEGCQEYVEASMYHVDIVIGDDLEPRCDVTLPIFDRLLWREALR